MIYHNQPYATLRAALQNQVVADLKKLATFVANGKKVPGRKAELVDFVTEQTLQQLNTIWSQLNDISQAAVAEMLYNFNPIFDNTCFVAKYGQRPTEKQLSLLFFNAAIPGDIAYKLKAFVPQPAESELKTSDEELPESWEIDTYYWEDGKRVEEKEQVTLLQNHSETLAIQELHTLLRLIDEGKIAVSDKTLQASTATMRKITASLPRKDFYPDPEALDGFDNSIGFIKAFAWPLLLQVGGLAECSGKKLQLSTAGQKALGDAPEKTFSKLWKNWLKYTGFDEFRRIDEIKGQTGKAKRSFTALAGRRKVIVEALSQLPSDQWVEVTEFFRQMHATGRNFEVTRTPWALYITNANYGYINEGEDWNILEGRYARCFLFEYVATLGLLDVAYIEPEYAAADYSDLWGVDDLSFLSRYDGLMFIRLTPLGEYCLGLSKTYTPGEAAQQALNRLSTFKKRAGKLTDKGAMRLFECSTPHMAASIMAEKKLAKWCTLIDKRGLLVAEKNVAQFRKVLLELGYKLNSA
ncbi:hypothetical protein QUF61_12305 [Candidatus Venteria ishoeyi]|uniref:hypothetical protein n=1 Tax=Candidatus Venteria ishoeyi TaxID=1899563 RepID=UPI0025A68866|nr:hypothetical protein [Candidatus Venteria ishoeyi]MDM8547270.1 hypothetical protein [Candidatus Venteria ishoeyi]